MFDHAEGSLNFSPGGVGNSHKMLFVYILAAASLVEIQQLDSLGPGKLLWPLFVMAGPGEA